MAETERVINDLNVVKITLCNPQMLLTPEMRVRIGQVITSAIDLLTEHETIVRCKDCKHFNDSRCLNDNIHYSIDDCGCKPAFYVADDWYCAEGERR